MSQHVYNHQSNTRQGRIVLPADGDLSGITTPRLVKIVSDSGAPKIALPANIADETPYLLLEGGAAGESATVEPLTPEKQIRVEAKDAIAPGEIVVQAAIATGDHGKIRKLPSGAGTYIRVGIAEETIAAGQFGLIRPTGYGIPIVVSG